MANDAPAIHIGENSPEYVAYLLMFQVNSAEKPQTRTRKEILDLYAECLLTVRAPSDRKNPRVTGRV
jgi:hypothetical protein